LASDITVHELGEPELDAWTTLVSASPEGSIYSLPRYLDVLCATAGGRFRVLGVRHGDELVGGVALYERPSRLGAFVSTRRLLYYNGIVLKRYDTKYPSEQTGRHLKASTALAEALVGRGYASLQLSSRGSFLDVRPFLAAGWSAAPQYTYVVPVGDLELLWSRVEQNLRRLIRRSEKEGAAVVCDDDFDAFFRLHAGTMGRKGQELYLPEEAFRRWFEALRAADLCRLFHARLPGGRAVASQLVLLGPRPVSHSVAAATDPEFMKSGVSALLRWKVFEAVSELGFAANDLTDASLNAVTHFKSQLGGDLQLFFSLEAPRSAGNRLASWAAAGARRAAGVLRGGGR
jgi:Acetyltransferase (GNAT) domain